MGLHLLLLEEEAARRGEEEEVKEGEEGAQRGGGVGRERGGGEEEGEERRGRIQRKELWKEDGEEEGRREAECPKERAPTVPGLDPSVITLWTFNQVTRIHSQ